jgi:hypothetical protein
VLWKELHAAQVPDDEINKITFENSCRYFDFDPFKYTPREQATVGALRALAADVDISTVTKGEYRARYEAAAAARA